MSLLSKSEIIDAWKRAHMPHPYGPTAALCHQERGIRFIAEEGHTVGMHDEANRAAMVKRLIDRKVIITTTTTAQRILDK